MHARRRLTAPTLLGLVAASLMTTGLPSQAVPAARATAPFSATTTLSPEGRQAQSAVIDGNRDGDLVAAWTLGPSDAAVLQVARRPAGGHWSAPVTVSRRGALAPRVDVGKGGRACLVWERAVSGLRRAQASCFAPGKGWSTARYLTPSGTDSDVVDVAMRGAAATFAWDRFGPSGRVLVARRSATGHWSKAEAIAGSAAVSASAPALGVDADGLATVAWVQAGTAEPRAVVVRRQKAGGGWSARTTLTDADQSAVVPRIAEVRRGDALVVWALSGVGGVWGAHRAGSTGAWGASQRLSPDGVAAAEPEVAANRTDDVFVAVWRVDTGGGPIIQASRRSADGVWDLPHRASTLDALAVTAPDVSLDAQQFATVVWQEHDGSQYRIGFARQSIAGTWTVPAYLDVATPNGAYTPSVTVFGDYREGIVWRRYDTGDKLRVETVRYDPAAA
ncbi:MAG: hypothetical protein U0R80_11410 [Nocardioidaceae bacterium]